jgi:aryl sulfotransferase
LSLRSTFKAMSAGIWWIASYPKSGSTWLRAAIASLLSDEPIDINRLRELGPSAASRALFDDTLAIRAADLSLTQETNLRPRAYEIWAAEAPTPPYCKTHDAYRLTPAGEPLFPTAVTRGAVYVVRDPRAVAVSFADHSGEPIDDTIALMNETAATLRPSSRESSKDLRQSLLRWGDHVESWLSAPFPVHLVRYEDMKTEPSRTFAQLADFLDIRCDRDRIAATVEATQFARLQAQEREAGFIEGSPRGAAFFREGQIDGWRRVLTADQATRIAAAHAAVMRRMGYDTAFPRSSETVR